MKGEKEKSRSKPQQIPRNTKGSRHHYKVYFLCGFSTIIAVAKSRRIIQTPLPLILKLF